MREIPLYALDKTKLTATNRYFTFSYLNYSICIVDSMILALTFVGYAWNRPTQRRQKKQTTQSSLVLLWGDMKVGGSA